MAGTPGNETGRKGRMGVALVAIAAVLVALGALWWTLDAGPYRDGARPVAETQPPASGTAGTGPVAGTATGTTVPARPAESPVR
jgi:hypothetical protein